MPSSVVSCIAHHVIAEGTHGHNSTCGCVGEGEAANPFHGVTSASIACRGGGKVTAPCPTTILATIHDARVSILRLGPQADGGRERVCPIRCEGWDRTPNDRRRFSRRSREWAVFLLFYQFGVLESYRTNSTDARRRGAGFPLSALLSVRW